MSKAMSIAAGPEEYGLWIQRAKSWAVLSTALPPPPTWRLAAMTGKPCTSPPEMSWARSTSRSREFRCRSRKNSAAPQPHSRAAGSIANGRTGRATGVAGPVEPAVRDLDQFDGTPRPLLDELVAHPGQSGDRLGGQARALVEDLVGQPLVVEAPRLDGLLRRHAVIDDVQDRLEHRGDDPRTAGAAEDEKDAAVLLDQGRGHRRERALAGGDRVRLALDETIEVRRAGLDGEVVHLVVQKKAGARGDHRGTKTAVDRVGHRNRVALGVNHRIMRRLGFFMRRLKCGGGCRLAGVDLGADCGRVVLRQQPLERVLHKVRIAEIAVAVLIGMAHRLDQQVHRLRRPEAERL